ncbi:hypothetical protein AB0K51_20695 [Kitasatospora sp. NPDC049285]|uniref:hypothetical protein n=1 Tax=Kitasatospora sp. NPDC049285 TaxID=3157096 RepID=UPI00343FA4E6
MRVPPAAAAVPALLLAVVVGCGSTATTGAGAGGSPSAVTVTAAATPTVTVTPTPTPTVTVTPNPTVTVTRPTTPAATAPGFTNAAAVVEQYYQDITNHDYAAAWALGGRNIGGNNYAGWVAGYATTASISLGTVSEFGSSQVRATIYATQTDGTVKIYEGTYTVANGVLVAASIRQTG